MLPPECTSHNEWRKTGGYLAPFFEKYICLLLSPECFDEPPAIPLIFNEATGCVYENGAWILESGEPQGCPLHVNPLQEAAES